MFRIRLSPLGMVSTICVVSLLAFAGRYVRANFIPQDAASQTVELIPQPSSWQPFEAQLTVTKPGAPTLSGYYYRASDGSDRYDEATADGSIRALTIVNVRSGWQYACNLVRNVCTRTATEKTRPIALRRVTTQGLVKSDQKIEGYELYEYTDASGLTHLQAPALNFASLVSHRADGSVFALTHIRLGEPSPSLFVPPPVAKMVDFTPPAK